MTSDFSSSLRLIPNFSRDWKNYLRVTPVLAARALSTPLLPSTASGLSRLARVSRNAPLSPDKWIITF